MKQMLFCVLVSFSIFGADRKRSFPKSPQAAMLWKAGQGSVKKLAPLSKKLDLSGVGGDQDTSRARRNRSGSAILTSEVNEATPLLSPRQSPRMDVVALHNMMHQRCKKEEGKLKLERMFYKNLSKENKKIYEILGHVLFMNLQKKDHIELFEVVKKFAETLPKDKLLHEIIHLLLTENDMLKIERKKNRMDGLHSDGSPRGSSPRVDELKKEKGPSPRRIDSPKLRRLSMVNQSKREQILQQLDETRIKKYIQTKNDPRRLVRIKSVPVLCKK
ncbi:MAG: hypothetical protein WD055_00220 [Candidatus Dependentiae bacterium]